MKALRYTPDPVDDSLWQEHEDGPAEKKLTPDKIGREAGCGREQRPAEEIGETRFHAADQQEDHADAEHPGRTDQLARRIGVVLDNAEKIPLDGHGTPRRKEVVKPL